jgi:hypothetical protein
LCHRFPNLPVPLGGGAVRHHQKAGLGQGRERANEREQGEAEPRVIHENDSQIVS